MVLAAQGKYGLKALAHFAALDPESTTQAIDSIRRRREEKAQRRGAGAPAKGFRRMSGLKRRASGRIPAMPPRLRTQPAQAELDPRPNALVTVIEEQFGHQLGAADGRRDLRAASEYERQDESIDAAGRAPGQGFEQAAQRPLRRSPQAREGAVAQRAQTAEPPPGPGDRSVSFAFAAGFGNDQPERDGIVADAVDEDKAAEIAAFPVRHQRHRPVESDGHPGEAVDVDGLGIHLAVVINIDGVIDRGDRCRCRARADMRDEAAAFARG